MLTSRFFWNSFARVESSESQSRYLNYNFVPSVYEGINDNSEIETLKSVTPSLEFLARILAAWLGYEFDTVQPFIQ